MDIFEYDIVRSTEINESERKQGLKLVMTAFCAQTLIHIHKGVEGSDDNHLSFDYYEKTMEGLDDIAKKAGADIDIDTDAVVSELKEVMAEIYMKATTKPTARPILTEFDTMMFFFSETTKELLTSFKVLESYLGQKVRGEVPPHHCSMELAHGSTVWVISFVQDSKKGVERTVTINGKEGMQVKGFEASYLQMLFNITSMLEQQALIEEYKFAALLAHYPNAEVKAKAMQKIIGGNWKDYIELSSFLSNEYTGKETEVSYDRGIEILLERELRTDENSIKEMVKIFAKKPLYH